MQSFDPKKWTVAFRGAPALLRRRAERVNERISLYVSVCNLLSAVLSLEGMTLTTGLIFRMSASSSHDNLAFKFIS